jgi:tetratricopeptide (TPR) repeat protein
VENENEIAVNKVSKLRRIIRYSVAVATSIFLVIIFIEGCKFYKLSSQKLYAENYTPYDLKATDSTVDSTVSKIEQAYREKKYGAVISLNKISVLSIKDVFLTGMSFLETNDYSRAISNFQLVIADVKDNKALGLKDAAEYYLALAYLRNNDYDQAIELMNTIHDSSTHLYKARFSRKYINRVKRLKWR